MLRHGESPSGTIHAPRWALSGSASSSFDTWRDPDRTRVEIEAEAAPGWHDALVQRGVDVGEVSDVGGVMYAEFHDPDGNSWLLQEFPAHLRR